MKYAVVDVGSNTIRTSVYQVENKDFKLLFSEKETAGLASYIKNGSMSEEGIELACEVIDEFKNILLQFEIDSVAVFATAALRNIDNTEFAIKKIQEKTGMAVEVISGNEEAVFSCYGGLLGSDIENGLLFDIGGASTEIVNFEKNEITSAASLPIGSLSLYSNFVTKFLPNKSEQEKIGEFIKSKFKDYGFSKLPQYDVICGVGGTARALLKMANKKFKMPLDNRVLSVEQIKEMKNIISKNDSQTRKIILKNCPDRIHTIIPGTMILCDIADKTKAKNVYISQYGVREGYLCKRMIGR